jgi:hypothetical protein
MKGLKPTSGGGGDYEIPSAESHPAVLTAIIDLGTHLEEFQGTEKNTHKVYFCWELTGDEVKKDGTRFLIGRDFTLSLNEKAGLRIWLGTWLGLKFQDGEDFDLSTLLGRTGLLTVEHKVSGTNRTYTKIASITKPPRGYVIPPARMVPLYLDLDEVEEDELPIELIKLPYLYGKPIPEVIRSSDEWKEKVYAGTRNGGPPSSASPHDDGDTPF